MTILTDVTAMGPAVNRQQGVRSAAVRTSQTEIVLEWASILLVEAESRFQMKLPRPLHPPTHPIDPMPQSSSPISELPDVGFLSEVSSEHRAFLACFGKFLRPQSGDVLIAEGDAQESLYLVLSGTLHIVASADERPVLLASFGAGESIGEINLFDPATASATAVVRAGGVIWSLSREELEAFLTADPEAGVSVMRGLLRMVAKRIRSMNAKLATVEQRASIHNFWTTNPQ